MDNVEENNKCMDDFGFRLLKLPEKDLLEQVALLVHEGRIHCPICGNSNVKFSGTNIFGNEDSMIFVCDNCGIDCGTHDFIINNFHQALYSIEKHKRLGRWK